jgi:hypothetical protein
MEAASRVAYIICVHTDQMGSYPIRDGGVGSSFLRSSLQAQVNHGFVEIIFDNHKVISFVNVCTLLNYSSYLYFPPPVHNLVVQVSEYSPKVESHSSTWQSQLS